MYKGKRKVLMKVLSLALAAGMSVSGLPVSALAAETADAEVQEESVVETETAIEPAEDSDETQEAEVPSEVEEAASSEVEEAASSEVEQEVTEEAEEEVPAETVEKVPSEEEVPEEEVPAEENDELPEESFVVNDAKKAEGAEALAKNGDGWDANHEKYYVNGEPVCDTVMEINGEYYGFDYEGYMERNTMFPIYDEEAERDIYYCATEDGPLVVNGWADMSFGPHYFGEGGRSACGFTQINGTMYFFASDGNMLTDRIEYNEEDGITYEIGHDGVAKPVSTSNGWYDADNGDRYYLVDGEPVKETVIEIEGDYYGFAYDGCLYRNQEFSIDIDMYGYIDYEKHYRATESGSLIVNDWYEDEEGRKYYYGEGGEAPEDGLKYIEDTQYYFVYAGNILIDEYYVDYETGLMFHADENGAAIMVEAEDGWVNLEDGQRAYFTDGKPEAYSVLEIDGKYYGFDRNGIMHSGGVFIMAYDDDGGVYYRAHEDGHLYVNEWAKDGNEWYYYFDEGRARYGLQYVNGKQYLFSWSGKMRTNTTYTRNGVTYVIGADGIARGTQLNDGWFKSGDSYYYVVNGEFITDQVRKIGGVYYGFDWDGVMYDDTSFSIERQVGDDFMWDEYRARKGGALYTNAWYVYKDEYYDEEPHNYWYYYGDDAKMVKGWKQIGGKWYYFNEDGEMVTGLHEINGNLYSFSAGGAMQTGWQKTGGSWHYFAGNGAEVKEWQKIGGVWYYFDEEGKMLTGLQEIRGAKYFFSAGGAMQTGWQKIDGSWYYFAGGGAAVKAWQKLGSVWYYFDEEGKMLTGLQEIGGAKYFFSAGGAMQTGWQKIDGSWYYFAGGGAAVKAWQKLGSVWYYFDEEGKMLTGLQEIRDAKYFFSAGGAMQTGWQKVGNDWYYFEAGGAAACGKWIGNYYLTESGVMAVNQWVDDHKYYVGPNGVWIPGYTENAAVS